MFLTDVISDAHIYDRHVPLVRELVSRSAYPAPALWLNPDITDFYQFTPADVKLLNYRTGAPVKNIPVAI